MLFMVIPFTILFIGIGYLCYQTKDEVYLIEEESTKEKDDIYMGLDDLFIWMKKTTNKYLSKHLLGLSKSNSYKVLTIF